jgi:hypothetical protein
MATELLAVNNTAANSSDLVVAAGTPVTVCIKGDTKGVVTAAIYLKDDTGGYNQVGILTTSRGERAIAITAPGTYRFARVVGETFGVFSA